MTSIEKCSWCDREHEGGPECCGDVETPCIDGLKDWLNDRWADCERCWLGDYRQNIVLGDIRPSPLIFIGEAPGQREDEQGRPFVGRAGQLLRQLALESGIDIERATILNTVACKPPQNRNPRPDELAACSPRLYGILKALQPRLIVTLGRVPSEWALQRKVPITRERGEVHDVEYPGAGTFRTLLAFHPAHVLRNPDAVECFLSDMRYCRDLIASGDEEVIRDE